MNEAKRASLVLVALLAAACGSAEPQSAKHAAQACSALGDPAKAAAPFYEAGNVYAARPVSRTVSRTRAFENRRIVGAELYMHATPGVTAEHLQRALSCHATAAAEAHPNDPLHPRGRVDEVGVRSTGAGFSILVTSNDAATAKEIWHRSQVFAGEDASVDVRQVPDSRAD